MSSYYDGRDLLKTQDIYGSQSSTNLKHRNITQEQFTPEVLRHMPDQYQRQADLQKQIRNPHYNDFRYDLMQQHPHFHASSIKTDFRDSLESFATSQLKMKEDMTRQNSHINYDYIRSLKNKNSYDSLNPPFANLQDNFNDNSKDNLKSTKPFIQSPNSRIISQLTHKTDASTSANRSIADASMMQYAEQVSSKASLANTTPAAQIKQSLAKITHQSRTPLRPFQPADEGNNNIYAQLSQPKPQQLIQAYKQQNMLDQSLKHTNSLRNMHPQMIPSPISPILNKRPSIGQNVLDISMGNTGQVESAQKYFNPTYLMNQGGHISGGEIDTNSRSFQETSNRKTYKPYNIISHNRFIPYTPKFDFPDVSWDKYDRQQFNDFDQKARPPVEIIKGKNDKLSIFSDYTTWNQKYGEPPV